MDELRTAILDYVRREYLEEGDDRAADADDPPHLGRDRRLLLDGLAQALPRAEVRREDPRRRRLPGGVRHGRLDRRARRAPRGGEGLTVDATVATGVAAPPPPSATSTAPSSTRSARPASTRRSGSSTPRRGPRSRSSSPPGAAPKKVLNLCSNNYLGLSSHPEVVAAAHAGLDSRGLRDVVRPLHLRDAGHPPRARAPADGASSGPRRRSSSPPASTRTPASSRRSSARRTS